MKLGTDKATSRSLILLVAVGVSLPMAWISLAKLALFAYAAVTLLFWQCHRNHWKQAIQPWEMKTLVLAVIAFSVSMAWTIVPMQYALHAWLKHSKLLSIVFLLVLLNTEARARLAMRWFIWAQSFVLLLSWLIAIGVSIPFTSAHALGPVVFAESYIDQSAMFGIGGALAWHLRNEGLWPRWVSFAIPLFAVLNVLLLLPGRSGYLIAIALISSATYWALPKRFRLLTALAASMTLVGAGMLFAAQFRVGVERAFIESVDFMHMQETKTSSGWRLNAWHRSAEAIAARPLEGYGVGSFVPAVKIYETSEKDKVFGTSLSSNPHQEFLLWGVELGSGGVLLLIVFLGTTVRSSLSMPPAIQRSVISVVITIVIACFFNSALYDDLIGDFLCFALGISIALGLAQKKPSTSQSVYAAQHNDGT